MEAIVRFFNPQGRHAAQIWEKFGMEGQPSMPNFTPIGKFTFISAVVKCGIQKTATFYQISKYKCPTRAYPLHNFYKIVESFMLGQLLKFGEPTRFCGNRVQSEGGHTLGYVPRLLVPYSSKTVHRIRKGF